MRTFFPSLTRMVLLGGAFLLTAASAARAQFVTDGTREAAYGAPLVVQTTPTGFGNANTGTPLIANGSELDAAYAVVSGGMLHVFLAGNLESNGNKLEVFFDTKPGGQNTLLSTNPDVDGNGLNTLVGLTFDSGFGADYYLTATITTPVNLAVSYATLNEATNAGGLLASGADAAMALTFPGSVSAGAIGLDNSNTGGVDDMSVGTPAAVATGVELLIPLAALGSPAADFRITAFINGGSHNFLSNQALGGLPLGAANLGTPGTVNFAAATNSGNQFFTVTNGGTPAPAASISATPNPVGLGAVTVGGSTSATLTVTNTGTAALSITGITSSDAVFTVAPTTITVAAGAATALTVTFAPTATGAQNGTLTITSNAAGATTTSVGLTGTGTAPTTSSVDGQLDPDNAYGAALAVQTTPTGFGDATTANNFGGSELDAAYARIANGNLYLLLTGNLEANGNDLEIFLDTEVGGQSILSASNPNVDDDGLNRLAGLVFDAGFVPDYYLTVQQTTSGGQPLLTANYAPLTGAGGTGITLTAGATGTAQSLDFGGGRMGSLALNNLNVAGVSATTVGAPESVTTGVELEIPLAALGNPTGSFRVAAFVNGGSHDFVSNQVLAGLPAGAANLGNPTAVDFTATANAGNQFFTIANAPAPTAGISVSPDPLAVANVTIGASGTGTLTVSNPGTAALVITGITSSNPVFSVVPTTLTISAGASATLTVTFVPTAVGAQTGTLTIVSNAAGAPSTTVDLTGTGISAPAPLASLSASTLSFGNVATGATATTTLRVRNTGTAPLTVSGITSDNGVFTATPTTGTVAPGDSLTVTISFAPTAAGAQTGTLTVATNDAANPTLTVALSGTGITPAVVTVDGTRDSNYGTALAVQTASTGFGNATAGDQQTANGSELDAAYARIEGSTLYLLLTGNLESNGNRLDLFFDTDSGTGQRTLGATNPNVDGDALNRMAGLTFDSGFTADYFLTLNATNPAAGFTTAAYFGGVNGAGGTGATLTNGLGRTQALAFGGGLTGALSLDNSNVAGVDGTTVGTPAAVTTGVELAIPLSALGNPTGPIRISAFINNDQHIYLSNQVLAGLPTGTGNLGGDGAGNFTGNVAGVNFAAFAGDQFFTVANGVAAPVITASATTLTFPPTVVRTSSTRRLVIRNSGNALLTVTGVTSTEPAFSADPVTGTVAVGDSLVLTVTFAPAAAGAFSGTLEIASNDPGLPTLRVSLSGTATSAAVAKIQLSTDSLDLGTVTVGATSTATVYVRNTGTASLRVSGVRSSNAAFTAAPTTGTVAPGDSLAVVVTFTPTVAGTLNAIVSVTSNDPTRPRATVVVTGTGLAAGVVTVDGSLDASYPTALAVQTTATGFGNATNGQVDVALGGSELDAAYARIANGVLYLLLTGNVESNGNKLEIFFDSQAGGQNVLTATNPDVDGNGLNRQAGLTFDAGFAPDYYLTFNNTNTAAFGMSASFAPINSAGGLGTLLTSGASRTQALAFGGGLTGALALNNSNIAGVDGTTVGDPAAVTTGVEFAIPLAALGNPTGPIRISAFINGGSHDFLSNQVLAGLPTGTANLGNPAMVNFNTPAGNQFFVVPYGTSSVINLSTTALAIGDVAVGSTGSATFYVSNTGTAALTLTDITSSGALFTAVPTTGTVAPGDSLLVTVTFAPTAVGPLSATLTLASNDPAQPTATVQVSGTGVAAPMGVLTVSATSLDLGSADISTSTTATFTLSNTGNAPLTNLSLGLPAGSVFSVSPTLAGPLAPGDSVTVTVTFTPTIAGAQTATLVIQLDGVQAATVALTGNGVLVGLPAELMAAVALAPNPTTGRTTLRLPAALLTRAATVDVLDAVGRTVRTVRVAAGNGAEAAVLLDLTGLPEATYAVRLRTTDGTLVRRLVLMAE